MIPYSHENLICCEFKLTLKHLQKMHLNILSTEVVCGIYYLISMNCISEEIEFKLFDQDASKTFQQTTKADNFCDWCFKVK